ncbi:aminoglycoside phosphotransferase family protein [Patescibacteria group bacterium]|nr:aminoglycoside phosphotransferase family protein [Patescibacteria group bacterium]
MIREFEKVILVENLILGYHGDLDFVKTQSTEGLKGKKVIFLVFGRNEKLPSLCIKTVRCASENFLIEKEVKALKLVQQKLKGDEERILPKLIKEGMINAYSYCIQEAVNGKRLKRSDTGFLCKILELISLIHHRFALGEIEIDDSFIDEHISGPVNNFLDFYNFRGTVLEGKATGIIEEFQKNKGLKIPLILQHGDFHFANIFKEGKKIKILDWENFAEISLPMYDLFTFLSSLRGEDLPTDEFLHLNGEEIKEYSEEFNIDEKLIKPIYQIHSILNFVKKIPLYNLNDFKVLEIKEVIF